MNTSPTELEELNTALANCRETSTNPSTNPVFSLDESIIKVATESTDLLYVLGEPEQINNTINIHDVTDVHGAVAARSELVKFAGIHFNNTDTDSLLCASRDLLSLVDKELVWGVEDSIESPKLSGLIARAEEHPKMLEADKYAFQEFLDEEDTVYASVAKPSFVSEGELPGSSAHIAWKPGAFKVQQLLPPMVMPLWNWVSVSDSSPGPDFLKDRALMQWYVSLAVYRPHEIKIHIR